MEGGVEGVEGAEVVVSATYSAQVTTSEVGKCCEDDVLVGVVVGVVGAPVNEGLRLGGIKKVEGVYGFHGLRFRLGGGLLTFVTRQDCQFNIAFIKLGLTVTLSELVSVSVIELFPPC